MYERYLECFRPDPDPNTPHFRIKLTTPPYKDVVLYLGKTLTMTEDKKVNFDYEILSYPPSVDVYSEGLVALMGGIILALLEKQFKNESQGNAEPLGSTSGPADNT